MHKHFVLQKRFRFISKRRKGERVMLQRITEGKREWNSLFCPCSCLSSYILMLQSRTMCYYRLYQEKMFYANSKSTFILHNGYHQSFKSCPACQGSCCHWLGLLPVCRCQQNINNNKKNRTFQSPHRSYKRLCYFLWHMWTAITVCRTPVCNILCERVANVLCVIDMLIWPDFASLCIFSMALVLVCGPLSCNASLPWIDPNNAFARLMRLSENALPIYMKFVTLLCYAKLCRMLCEASIFVFVSAVLCYPVLWWLLFSYAILYELPQATLCITFASNEQRGSVCSLTKIRRLPCKPVASRQSTRSDL